MAIFEATYRVSFGDCDPAGIVYYPNLFAWLDRTFHTYLSGRGGGHMVLCRRLGAKGIGPVKANCDFHLPATENDELTVAIEEIEWHNRTFTVRYAGLIDGRTVFNGTESRAQFVERDGRLHASDLAALRAILADDGAVRPVCT